MTKKKLTLAESQILSVSFVKIWTRRKAVLNVS